MQILTDNVIDNRACQCVIYRLQIIVNKLSLRNCTTPWTQVETVIVLIDNKWISNRHNWNVRNVCLDRRNTNN